MNLIFAFQKVRTIVARQPMSWCRRLGLSLMITMGLMMGGCSKESRAARHLAKGDDFYAAGEYDKARLEYISAIQLDPRNVRSIGQLGNIFFEDGIVLQARSAFQEAIKLGTTDPRVPARLGIIMAAGKQFALAREDAQRALELDPASEDALFLLADIANDDASAADFKKRVATFRTRKGNLAVYDAAEAAVALRRHNLPDALSLAQSAVKSQPDLGAAQFVLAGVYLSQSNLTAGESAIAKAAELSPPRSTRQLQYFNFLAQRGETNEALALLDKVIKAAPDFVTARLRRAQIALAERDFALVGTEISAVLNRDPINIEARVLQAQLRLARHDPEKALAIMDQLIKQFPDAAQLQYQAAVVSLANQNAAQAQLRLDRAFELNPGAADVVLLRGRLYLARGQADEVIKSVQGLIARDATVRPAYPLLGEAFVAKGEMDRALAVFRDYESRFKNDPAGPLNLGLVLLRNKDVEQARAAFERAVVMRPDFLPAVEQLVRIELSSSNTRAAISRAQTLVDQQPKSAEARVLLGQAQLAAKDAKQAEASFEKAIELDPQLASSYLLLAQVYDSTNRREEAIARLKGLLKERPDDQKALMMLGVLLTKKGSYEEAASSYEALLKKHGSFSPALNNLAYLYSEKLNKLDRAYDLARRSRDLLPNDPRIADTLGWILFHRHEYSQALVYLEESAGQLAENGEVQYHRGMAHYAMGHEAQARSALQLALKLDPKAEWRDEITSRLAVLDASDTGNDPSTLKRLEQLAASDKGDVILLSRLARAQEGAQKWDDALVSYRRAASANPDAASPLVGQARVLAMKGDFAGALDLARKARDLAKSDPATLFEIGRIAYLARDFSWAFALLQDSLPSVESDSTSQFTLAQAAIAVGRLDVAKDALAKVSNNPRSDLQLALIPSAVMGTAVPLPTDLQKRLATVQPGELLADYLKARSLAVAGNVSGAEQALDDLLKKYPQFLPAKRSLALLLVSQAGEVARAEKLAREVRDIQPNDAEMARVLGQVALQRSDFRYAADLLQEASRTLTRDGELFYLLGQARAQNKQVADARQAINKALALPLSDTLKQRAQELLQKLE